MALVVDASALVAMLVGQESAAAVDAALGAAAGSVAAPELLDIEVTSAIRRQTLAGRMSAPAAARSMEELAQAPITRHRHGPLLQRVWQLRHNLTAHDAAYVALAEILDAPLLTADATLANSPGHTARIELI